jgi:hypothetical protein
MNTFTLIGLLIQAVPVFFIIKTGVSMMKNRTSTK